MGKSSIRGKITRGFLSKFGIPRLQRCPLAQCHALPWDPRPVDYATRGHTCSVRSLHNAAVVEKVRWVAFTVVDIVGFIDVYSGFTVTM